MRILSRSFAFGLQVIGLFLGAIALSCVAVVDSESLGGGCLEGQKECSGVCVDAADPDYGCGNPSCSPCAIPQATATCGGAGNKCQISVCIGAFDDCDGATETGCEVDLDTDTDNCGQCGLTCESPADAEAACGGSACFIRSCEAGFGDCDGAFDTGCEVELSSDVAHCGACGHFCDGECRDGMCDD